MNNEIPENTIQDVVGLPISISHCAHRVNCDYISAFSIVGTPHILRFRRVFNNLTDLGGNYDIYIDCDFKLLLYNDDRTGFTTVTDNNGDLVNIPVYQFTDNAPYTLPEKQPAPFYATSSKEAQIINEIHELLNSEKTSSSVSDDRMNDNSSEPQPAPTSENVIPASENAASAFENIAPTDNDDNRNVGELITVKGIDTGANSADDDYAKPQPIPDRKNTVSNAFFSYVKKSEDYLKQIKNSIEQISQKDDSNIEDEQLGVPEEVLYDTENNDDSELPLEDTDSAQIDFAENDPQEKNTNRSEHEGNACEYYAKQLIQKHKPPSTSANLSMDNGTSVSVSEESLHKESEKTNSDAVSQAAENTAPSAEKEFTNKDIDSLSAKQKNGKVNYVDTVVSGVQLELSGKIGIENMELCKIEKRSSRSKDKKEKEPDVIFRSIANFCLVPTTIEHHIYADSDKTFIHIAVFSPEFLGEYRKLLLDAEDIEKVGKIVRQKFPQLYYDPDLNSAPKYISTALSIMMSGMPQKSITHFYGWRNFNGRFIYLNDNIDENPLFKSESGKSLLFDPNMFRGDALIYTFRMLKLSKDINKTLPLFLTAHLGVMYSFFEMAGYAPRFVLFLRGETGSLKTSISKVFFRFLADGNNEIPANFNDTMTALEIKMGTTRDEVFLVDDFRPSSMNSELARMQANLEKLIRFYGDGIGKGRGNISLELRKEFNPHSMCAVTGEYIHGTVSSLQRLLIVSVDKNTYDRSLLKFYQDNPRFYHTHINFFITYLSQNPQKIVPYISSKFIEKRAHYTAYLDSKRLVDTAVCLEITAEIILLFYANECKLVHPMDVQPQLDIWKKCILNFVRESELVSNNREPVDMFCTAIAEIARNDIQKILPSKTLFEENINYSIGYYDYSARTLYLKPRESYTEVVQYWSKQGIPFAVKENPLRQELLLSGMVRGSVDGDSLKTSTPIRINGKATRMLELDLIKFNNKYTVFALPPSPLMFP